MYYLFEYRTSEGYSYKTYGPYRCLAKLNPNIEYYKGSNGKTLIDRLNNSGIVHKYNGADGWKTIYLKITHDNVIHGGDSHYKRILKLIKQYNRRTNLEKLLE